MFPKKDTRFPKLKKNIPDLLKDDKEGKRTEKHEKTSFWRHHWKSFQFWN